MVGLEPLAVHVAPLVLPQVCCLLAGMEARGMAFDAPLLPRHRATVTASVDALQEAASRLVGRSFNMGSSAQLAEVLYTDLRLPVPATTGACRATTRLGEVCM